MISKFTRDIIQSEIADFFAGVVEIHTELGGPNTVEEAQNQLTDRVLACVPVVDSDPVAWMHSNNDIGIPAITVSQKIGHYWMAEFENVQPLYRHAQPEPVVPDEMTIRDACKFVQDMRLFDDVSVIVMRTWNACRTAMLQENAKSAGESNNCRSNEKVQVLQAGTFRENGNSSTNNFREIEETSTNRSRENFISLCNEFWGWSEMDMICADDKGYELRLEWNGQSFTHPVTRGLWRMYQAAHAGIPIISDGYVMMPKEPTEAMMLHKSGCQHHAWDDPDCAMRQTRRLIWSHMLAAAPQLPGSEPAAVPGAWIPVSERLPEPNKFVLVSNGVWVGQGLYDDSEHLESDEHWQDEHREFINVLHYPVTHWMPLPNPPKEVPDGQR